MRATANHRGVALSYRLSCSGNVGRTTKGSSSPGLRGLLTAGMLALAGLAGPAHAGGSAENAVLIIDPTNAGSLYLGNYYKVARNIPESRVIYMRSAATNYAEFTAVQQAALQATLTQRGLNDLVDYIIVAPADHFFVSASNLITDACFPVNRFSIGSAYTMSFISQRILTTTPTKLDSQELNRYFGASNRAFDSETLYRGGNPDPANADARRYYIGALLGYTGTNGNTPEELVTVIDRAVAADGTRPTGTFRFMNNTADPDRNVRVSQFTGVITNINNLAGPDPAAQASGVVPSNQQLMGLLTGAQTIDLPASGSTLLPGSFADHLTSWAATFDIGAQTKVSYWLRQGAAGSAGTVEEPCNFTGKFPHARVHQFIYAGMSHGEAYLRSMQFVPFQSIFVGDPLCRPYAYIPSVSVTGVPATPATAPFIITPQATTTAPGASVDTLNILIDGVRVGTITPGQSYVVNTYGLDDGHHELRVMALDNTLVRSVGSWTGDFLVNNVNRQASVGVSPASGDRTQLFTFQLGASNSDLVQIPLREIRLMQGTRVLASTSTPGPVSVYGHILGSGVSELRAEAVYADGRKAISPPTFVNISTAGAPAAAAVTAYGYSVDLRTATPHLIELPASLNATPAGATYSIVTPPAQATIVGGTGPWRVIRPNTNAAGTDSLTFRVQTTAGSSTATIAIRYGQPCMADLNGDRFVDDVDFVTFASSYAEFSNRVGDLSRDGFTDDIDFTMFAREYERFGCP